MHPLELIDLLVVFAIVIVLALLSFQFHGKWRRRIRVATVCCVLAYGIFYAVRPYWVNQQVQEEKIVLEAYLKDRYPTETITVRSIPYGENGFESMNPHTLFVKFSTEPDAEYTYLVSRDESIHQTSHSSTIDSKFDFLHLED